MKRQNRQVLLLSILFNIIVIIYLFISQSAKAQQPLPQWVSIYDANHGVLETLINMSLDSSGNIYVSSQSSGFSLIKYNKYGQKSWSTYFDSGYAPYPREIYVTRTSNIYLNCISGETWHTFKFDTSGNYIWSRLFEDSFATNNFPPYFAVDEKDNVYITGDFWIGGKKIGLIKYDSSGNLLWSRYYNYPFFAEGQAIVLDGLNNIYTGGYIRYIDGSRHAILIKYDSSGNQIWDSVFDDTTYDESYVNKLCCDTEGNIISGITAYKLAGDLTHCGIVKFSKDGIIKWFNYNSTVQYISNELIDMKTDVLNNTIICFTKANRNGGITNYGTTKFDSLGIKIWEKNNEYGYYDNRPASIFVDFYGNSYVTGIPVTIKYDTFGNLKWLVNHNKWAYPFYDKPGFVVKVNKDNEVIIAGNGYTDFSNSEDVITVKYSQNNTGINFEYEKNESVLYQNYPNPFNPNTKINFALPKQGFVTLKIYDITGREIQTLVNEKKQEGYYTVDFNGAHLSSGVYFYRIQSGDFVQTKRMVLVK